VSGRLAREGPLGTLLGGRSLEDIFLEVVTPAGGGAPPVSRDD